MKAAVNNLLWTVTLDEDQLDLLDKVAGMGFDGVEITLFDLDAMNLEATADALKKNGLTPMGCSVVTPEANPISPDPDVRNAAVQYLCDRVDAMKALGGTCIGGPNYAALGDLPGRGPTGEEKAWCVDVLKQVAEHAEREGVTLALEPINRFETYFLNTVDQALEIVEAVGSPNVKVHIDTFHANIEEKDTADAIRKAGSNLGHFHISESDRGVPGTGQVHWDDVFAALKEIGYDGWLAIESFGSHMEEIRAAAAIWRPLAANDEEIATEGLAFIRKMAG